ncbi:hypothetical protein B0H13DRAFT_1888775 [Mycena leptocephala]|nr:hypothetical protein B0H13DRAFT_1888775 [Mycena leptocephala]
MIVKSSVAFRSTVGETVHPERIRTSRQGQATYHQNYGLSPNSLMLRADSGKVTDTGWVLLLPKPQTITKLNPTGVQRQLDPQQSETYYGAAWVIRTGREIRRTVEPLPPPEGKNSIVRMSEECGAKFPHMVPGVEKAGNFTWVSHLSTQYKTVHLH